MAITHDDDWMWAIQEREKEMPDDEELVFRVRDNFTIEKVDGMCGTPGKRLRNAIQSFLYSDGLCYGYFERPEFDFQPESMPPEKSFRMDKDITQFLEAPPVLPPLPISQDTERWGSLLLEQLSELMQMVSTEDLQPASLRYSPPPPYAPSSTPSVLYSHLGQSPRYSRPGGRVH
ncbi:hypothetical protein BDP27DRAFT_346802 [Rhodocollybia butyracea]|uniref:Uncharacterized protein n=1 Tax=Rhodocollybia butyracea TaxID=206335 RepID=A0A9P5QA28_9AGAR|nr:hypothetical protein BDP27DRAFT_346802 [Rhodocollybia butyracea]